MLPTKSFIKKNGDVKMLELIARGIGGALGLAIVGFVIAIILKLIFRSKRISKWPIYTFAAIGFINATLPRLLYQQS